MYIDTHIYNIHFNHIQYESRDYLPFGLRHRQTEHMGIIITKQSNISLFTIKIQGLYTYTGLLLYYEYVKTVYWVVIRSVSFHTV